MKLYDMTLSGNAYKIRLMLALLGMDYETQPVSLADGENRTDDFLALNPRGQVPVLVDGAVTLWDSQAILVYLARRYGDEQWLPLEAAAMANVMAWMAVAENECLFGLARARAVRLFSRPWPLEQCQDYGRAGLAVMDQHLRTNSWLAGDSVTIADVACYPYVALAEEGDIALADYSHVLAWMGRIQGLERYTDMPGIKDAAA